MGRIGSKRSKLHRLGSKNSHRGRRHGGKKSGGSGGSLTQLLQK